MASNTASVGVLIGRFQPFHSGHAHILKRLCKTTSHQIILIGSAYQPRTIKNPFTFVERGEMIDDFANSISARPTYAPLRDQPYNDAKWIQSVQETVKTLTPADVDVTLFGSDRDLSTWYLNAFPQWKLDLANPIDLDETLNATALRSQLFTERFDRSSWTDVPSTTTDFLEHFTKTENYKSLCDEYEFIQKYKSGWSRAPYPVTFVTVDAVVIQSGHVLVIERKAHPGKGLWALPGGFVNQNERLEAASIRELIEETAIKIPVPILKGSIKAKEIFDHPDRSLRGRTISTAYLFRLDDTKPLPKVKGGDDAVNAFWLPIAEARSHSQKWYEDHLSILDTMLGKIND